MKLHCLLLLCLLSAFMLLSTDAVSGCNVFRVADLGGNDVLLVSETSLCNPNSSNETDPVTAPDPEPSDEDKSAWVEFVNAYCIGGSTMTSLQQIEDRNLEWNCSQTKFAELPVPAPTKFTLGLNVRFQNLTNLDGLSYVKSLPKLDISYTAVSSLLPLSQVNDLTTLDASRGGLVSLDGLENNDAIVSYLFNNTGINNINALSNVKSIGLLNLSQTNVTSIAPLSSVTSLGKLYMQSAPLQSLVGLEGVTTVEAIDAYSTNITSLRGLDNLTSATGTLDFRYARNLTSLDGLEKLTSTQFLFFRESRGLNDVRGLSNLASANRVDFYNVFSSGTIPNHRMAFDSPFCMAWKGGSLSVLINSGSYNHLCEEDTSDEPDSYWVRFVNDQCDISKPLGDVAQVETTSIYCYNKGVTNLPNYSEITKINSMDFRFNNINYITGMSNVALVTNTLNMESIGLKSLQGFDSLATGNTLKFSYNSINSLSGLESLSSVGTLHVLGNNISDLRPLSNLRQATELRFDNNNIGVLYGLDGLTSIGNLYLGGNPLYSLEGLENLSSATSIVLTNASKNIMRKLPDDTPFCAALRAGNLGAVTLDAGVTIDDLCDADVTVAEQGERSLGEWVMEGLMEEVGSIIGAMTTDPASACNVGEIYYKAPQTREIKFEQNNDCGSNNPWGYQGTQNYGNNYVNSSSSGGTTSGSEGVQFCYAVEVFRCATVEPKGHWEFDHVMGQGDDFSAIPAGWQIVDVPSGACVVGSAIYRNTWQANSTCYDAPIEGGTIPYCNIMEKYSCAQ